MMKKNKTTKMELKTPISKKMSRQYPLKKYEIWVGWHHFGTGHDSPSEPMKVGEETAPNFKTACVLHELKNKLKTIEGQIEKDEYLSDQDLRWWYDVDKNWNSWLGPYFETYEEALKTFKQ